MANYGYLGAVVLDANREAVAAEPANPKMDVPGLAERLRSLRADSDVVELPPYVDREGILHWDLLTTTTTGRTGGPYAWLRVS